MYEFLRGIHNLVRWVVVLGGVYALATMIRGIATSSAWTMREQRAGLIFISSLHLQLVLGLILFVTTPLLAGGLRSPMSGRLSLLEHVSTMIVAVIVAQLGYSMSKRVPSDRSKYWRATVGYLLAALLIFWATPWGVRLIPWT